MAPAFGTALREVEWKIIVISSPGQSAEQGKVRYAGCSPLVPLESGMQAMPHNGMHLQLLEPALHQNIAFGVGRTGSIRRAQRWLGLARSNMLGRRLGGGIDRTAHLGRRDWRDWLTGTTFTWLLGMLGGTAKHCSTETWKFLKASIGWLDGLEGEKAEGRGFGGEEKAAERMSRSATRPLPVRSPLPTMGNQGNLWLKMDGGLTRAAGYERR